MMTLDHSAALQELIDSGMAWRLEGAVGRECFAAIEAGFCMLGEDSFKDYWGNHVPSRTEVAPGSIGSQGYFEAKQDELEYQASFDEQDELEYQASFEEDE